MEELEKEKEKKLLEEVLNQKETPTLAPDRVFPLTEEPPPPFLDFMEAPVFMPPISLEEEEPLINASLQMQGGTLPLSTAEPYPLVPFETKEIITPPDLELYTQEALAGLPQETETAPTLNIDLSKAYPQEEEKKPTDLFSTTDIGYYLQNIKYSMQESNEFYKSIQEIYDFLKQKNVSPEKVGLLVQKVFSNPNIPEWQKQSFEKATIYYLKDINPQDNLFELANISKPILYEIYNPQQLEKTKQLLEVIKNPELIPEEQREQINQLKRYVGFVELFPEEVQPEVFQAVKMALENNLQVPDILEMVLKLRGYDKEEKQKNLNPSQRWIINSILEGKYKEGWTTGDWANFIHSFGIEAGSTIASAFLGGIPAILATWAGSLGAAHYLQDKYVDYFNHAVDFIKTYGDDLNVIKVIAQGKTPKELEEFAKKKGLASATALKWVVEDILKKGAVDPRIDFSYNLPAIAGEVLALPVAPLSALRSLSGWGIMKYFTERELINLISQATGQKVGELTEDLGGWTSHALSLTSALISGGFTGRTLGKIFGNVVKEIHQVDRMIKENIDITPRAELGKEIAGEKVIELTPTETQQHLKDIAEAFKIALTDAMSAEEVKNIIEKYEGQPLTATKYVLEKIKNNNVIDTLISQEREINSLFDMVEGSTTDFLTAREFERNIPKAVRENLNDLIERYIKLKEAPYKLDQRINKIVKSLDESIRNTVKEKINAIIDGYLRQGEYTGDIREAIRRELPPNIPSETVKSIEKKLVNLVNSSTFKDALDYYKKRIFSYSLDLLSNEQEFNAIKMRPEIKRILDSIPEEIRTPHLEDYIISKILRSVATGRVEVSDKTVFIDTVEGFINQIDSLLNKRTPNKHLINKVNTLREKVNNLKKMGAEDVNKYFNEIDKIVNLSREISEQVKRETLRPFVKLLQLTLDIDKKMTSLENPPLNSDNPVLLHLASLDVFRKLDPKALGTIPYKGLIDELKKYPGFREVGEKLVTLAKYLKRGGTFDNILSEATSKFINLLNKDVKEIINSLPKGKKLEDYLPKVETYIEQPFVQFLQRVVPFLREPTLKYITTIGALKFKDFIRLIRETIDEKNLSKEYHEILDDFLTFAGTNGRGIYEVFNKMYYLRDIVMGLSNKYSPREIVDIVSAKLIPQVSMEFLASLREASNNPEKIRILTENLRNEYLLKEENIADVIYKLKDLTRDLHSFFIERYHGDITQLLKTPEGKEANKEIFKGFVDYINNLERSLSEIVSKLVKQGEVDIPFLNDLRVIRDELNKFISDISSGSDKQIKEHLIKISDLVRKLIADALQFDVLSPHLGDFLDKLSTYWEVAGTIPKNKFAAFRRLVMSNFSNLPSVVSKLVFQNIRFRRGLTEKVGILSSRMNKVSSYFANHLATLINEAVKTQNWNALSSYFEDLAYAGMVRGKKVFSKGLVQAGRTADYLLNLVKNAAPTLEEISRRHKKSVKDILLEIYNSETPVDFVEKYREFISDERPFLGLLAHNNLVGLSVIRAIEDKNSNAYKLLPDDARKVIDNVRDVIETISLELSKRGLLPKDAPFEHYIHYVYMIFTPEYKEKVANSKLYQISILEEAENYAFAYEEMLSGFRKKFAEIVEETLKELPENVDLNTVFERIAGRLQQELKIYSPPALNLLLDRYIENHEEVRKVKTRFMNLVEDKTLLDAVLADLNLRISDQLERLGIGMPSDDFYSALITHLGKEAGSELETLLKTKVDLPDPETLAQERELLLRAVYQIIQDLGVSEITPIEAIMQKYPDVFRKGVMTFGVKESFILNPRVGLDFSLKRLYMQSLNPIVSLMKLINKSSNLLLHHDVFDVLNSQLRIIVDDSVGKGNPEYMPLSKDPYLKNLPQAVKNYLSSLLPNTKEIYIHKDFIEGLKDLYNFQYGFSSKFLNILRTLNQLQAPFKVVHVLFNVGVITRNIIGNAVAAALGSDSKLTTGIAVLKSGLESIVNRDKYFWELYENGYLRLNPSVFQEIEMANIQESPLKGFAQFLLKMYDLGTNGKILNTMSMLNAIFDDAVRVGLYKYYLAQGNITRFKYGKTNITESISKTAAMERARSFSFDYIDIPPLFRVLRDTVMPFVSFPYLSLKMLGKALSERPVRTASLVIAPILLSEFIERNYDLEWNWEPFSFVGNYMNMLSLFTAPTEATRMLFSAPWVSATALLLTGNDIWTGREIFKPTALYFGTVAEKKEELAKLFKGILNFFVNNYVPDIYQDLAFGILYGLGAFNYREGEPFFNPTYAMQNLLGIRSSGYFQPLPLRILAYWGINLKEINYERLRLELTNEILREKGKLASEVRKIEAFGRGSLWQLLSSPAMLEKYLGERLRNIRLGMENLEELAGYLGRGIEGLRDYFNRTEASSILRIIKYPMRYLEFTRSPDILELLKSLERIR